MTDKSITHDEARDRIILSFEEHITLLQHHKLSDDLIKKWEKELVDYITQQEQFAKDVAKLMYYLEYKEKWTEKMDESLQFHYYKVLNKVGKEE